MSKHVDRAIASLRSDLVEQFSVVEQMIGLSVRALVERRPEFAQTVIDTDDQVDARDIEIEEECLKLLALHQPVSEDLRWIITAVKINGDLERMADLACNIAERSRSLDYFPLFRVPDDMTKMVSIVIEMVRLALDSFLERDIKVAQQVISRDDEVDELNVLLIEQLHDLMRQDPEMIEAGVHCFSASRHLERIADMATHVAEETVYLVSGEIIRHSHGAANGSDESSSDRVS